MTRVSPSHTYDSILELVGNTPLVRLNRIAGDIPASIYVKLDHYNIGGSSKDRIGLRIVDGAVARGDLHPGGRIVDSGQGNTALGYALAAVNRGYRVSTVVTPAVQDNKVNLLRFLGARLLDGDYEVDQDDPRNPDNVALGEAGGQPNSWYAHQKENGDNPAAHYDTTGPELWDQTEGRITHFIAALATGGTASGTGTYLKERNSRVRVIGSLFDDSQHASGKTNLLPVFRRDPGWESLEHNWPRNINFDVIDDIVVGQRAEIIDLAWRVARTEGLVVGISTILSLKVALDIGARSSPDDVIVVFSADSGRDYLDREYNLGWLRGNGYGDIAEKYS
ncbi:PLP-dependent cysteine synthase family protein [Corynebacterium pacaense]|uniref:PLP-dependent cysteine synthase family protein n=1 Tax=Corynebacterium pacaense TaxID=1816684 RepID=UPI0009BB2A6F|nr:pyridoxal-phosphate dependent enzyme [Corynebacterium pacaense]